MDDEGVDLLPGGRCFVRDTKPTPDIRGGFEDSLSDFFDAARNLVGIERHIEPEDIGSPDDGALGGALRQDEMGELTRFKEGIAAALAGGQPLDCPIMKFRGVQDLGGPSRGFLPLATVVECRTKNVGKGGHPDVQVDIEPTPIRGGDTDRSCLTCSERRDAHRTCLSGAAKDEIRGSAVPCHRAASSFHGADAM